jgi:cytochrome oxidase Cu insertion factor (SCO1/SenC/PrrC family)
LTGIPCKQIKVVTETKFLPDLILLDQNGRRVRFYSDLIKDKIVLISFFYTSCTYAMPDTGESLF